MATDSKETLIHSRELIAHILAALKENASIMSEVTVEMKLINTEIANLKLSQEELEDDVKEIKIRKELFDKSIESLERNLEKIHSSIQSIENDNKEDKRTTVTNRILIVIAVLGALATITAAFIQIYPSLFK